MFRDTGGFSSVIDTLLFLVLISLCAVILAPAIAGSSQITALHDENAAEHNSRVLLSLMNGRVDDFNYTVGGAQMDHLVNEILGPDALDSGIYQTGKKLVANRELKHKTFGDLASESVASQFVIWHNGSSVRLNLLTDEYRTNINNQMHDYLDRQIGERYDYHVSVEWRPLKDIPIGGETHMGKDVPETAYVESAWITMPYHTEYTRKYVEDAIRSQLEGIGIDLERADKVPREETEQLISGHMNDAINRTVDDTVAIIMEMIIENTLGKAQTSLHQQIDNTVPGNNSGISDIILEEILEEMNSNPDFCENANQSVRVQIEAYLKQAVREEMHEVTRDEVEALASEVTDQYVSKSATAEDVKDQVLDYVFSRMDISRARMTLALWDRNI